MAELVDAHDSKSCDGNIVWVRFPPSAPMLTIILGIVGFVGYLYLSWRTLRDNYQEEDVVAFSWVALLLFLVGGRVSFGLMNWGIWSGNAGAWLEFWKINEISILGGSILWMTFTLLITKDKGWKIWVFLENSLVSFCFLLIILGLIIKNWPLVTALFGAVLLSMLMKKRYRSLLWYKSGKKGFLFFWFYIWFWLIYAVFSKLWWVGLLSLLFVVGLFILGDDKFSE